MSSSTFRLNVSAFCGTGGACKGCLGCIYGVFRGCGCVGVARGAEDVFCVRNGSCCAVRADECKPLGEALPLPVEPAGASSSAASWLYNLRLPMSAGVSFGSSFGLLWRGGGGGGGGGGGDGGGGAFRGLGPGGVCSPRHRMMLKSRNEGLKCGRRLRRMAASRCRRSRSSLFDLIRASCGLSRFELSCA